jgi:hypothetical protein
MSETLSILVSSGPSIEQCREVIEDQLRIPLRQRSDVEWCLFESEISGVSVSLFDDHGLEDDYGIEFTKFKFEIDFTRYAGTAGPEWTSGSILASAVALAKRLSTEFGVRTIVVENLSRIVQSFGTSAA